MSFLAQVFLAYLLYAGLYLVGSSALIFVLHDHPGSEKLSGGTKQQMIISCVSYIYSSFHNSIDQSVIAENLTDTQQTD